MSVIGHMQGCQLDFRSDVSVRGSLYGILQQEMIVPELVFRKLIRAKYITH